MVAGCVLVPLGMDPGGLKVHLGNWRKEVDAEHRRLRSNPAAVILGQWLARSPIGL